MCCMKRRISITLGNVVLLLLTGMSLVGALSVRLFAHIMQACWGETAFPTIVSECFWVCVWLALVEVVFVAVVAIAAWLLSLRRMAW